MSPRIAVVVLAAAVLVAACGAGGVDSSSTVAPDVTVVPPSEPAATEPTGADHGDHGTFDHDAALESARALLGVREEDLADDVRVARRGSEEHALTMDLRPGRLTVELDDDGSGYRVVAATVETPDGSETVAVDGG
jgi:hypothetical protein